MRVRLIRQNGRQAILCLGLAAFAGCSGDGRLEVAPVSGRVEFKGQGVPGATVIFHPHGDVAAKDAKLRPFAYADEQGNFRVKTYVTDDGAAPGIYRVSIVAASAPPVKGPSKDQVVTTDGPAAASTGPRIPQQVSDKFANVETAGIEVTIHEGENKLEPFKLDN